MAFISRHHYYRLTIGLLAAMLAMPCGALAEQPIFNDNALVTIRFNQPRVYYDQQLYGAIAKAIEVKPSVTFDIVAYAPATGNTAVDAQWRQAASTHAQMVIGSMQSLGVPLSRMNVTGQHMPGLKFDEVHVIAR